MSDPINSDDTTAQPPETDAAPTDESPAAAASATEVDAAAAKDDDEPAKAPPQQFAASAVLEERLERMRRKQKSASPVPQLERDPTIMPNLTLPQIDEELEKELEEALGGMTDEEMYGDAQPAPGSSSGQEKQAAKKGTVISLHGPDVFVDVPGSRSQGVLPLAQFPEGKPDIGTEVDVEIEGYDNANGLLMLSRKGVAVQADWSSVAVGMTVEARVTDTNKGGLSVDVNGIRGFMPISQIDLYRVENTEPFVNEKLLCEVIEVNPETRNLVVSRRALLERQREEQREKLLAELAEGQVREGVVRKVENFGAFVDLGGVDGLLHVSEMSWARVNHPKDVVHPGQTLKVAVLKVDPDRRRISLGLKQLMESPWDRASEKYPAGRMVTGKVTRLADFGAFVELEPGVEGLIHISELANHRVHRAADVVQTGQEVNVQVLVTDIERQRISLSLRAVAEEEEAEAEEQAEEEAPAKPARRRTEPLRGGIGGKLIEFERGKE